MVNKLQLTRPSRAPLASRVPGRSPFTGKAYMVTQIYARWPISMFSKRSGADLPLFAFSPATAGFRQSIAKTSSCGKCVESDGLLCWLERFQRKFQQINLLGAWRRSVCSLPIWNSTGQALLIFEAHCNSSNFPSKATTCSEIGGGKEGAHLLGLIFGSLETRAQLQDHPRPVWLK